MTFLDKKGQFFIKMSKLDDISQLNNQNRLIIDQFHQFLICYECFKLHRVNSEFLNQFYCDDLDSNKKFD